MRLIYEVLAISITQSVGTIVVGFVVIQLRGVKHGNKITGFICAIGRG